MTNLYEKFFLMQTGIPAVHSISGSIRNIFPEKV
jgi:hypothetical protein